jgi:hypothetical protein
MSAASAPKSVKRHTARSKKQSPNKTNKTVKLHPIKQYKESCKYGNNCYQQKKNHYNTFKHEYTL